MLIRPFLLASFVSIGFAMGCSQTPTRVSAPSWDPDGFADAAMTKLDGNSDGLLDKSELIGAPGLAWGARFIDSDKNEQLSREELVARFSKYDERSLGLTTKTILLLYKQRPLVGAKVTLAPEFFLEGVVEPATSETGPDGEFFPQTEGMDLTGVRVGYYRVVVESPNVKIPAKFGSAETTTAGVEISPFSDDPSTYGTLRVVLQGE